MKTIIKNTGKIIAIFLLIQIFTACSDFLTETPKTQLTDKQVYTEKSVLEKAVGGLYTSYRNAKAGRAGLTFTLLGTDEVKQGIVQMSDAGQSGLDYYDGALNASSSQISEMWARRWPAINTAAKCIRGLEDMMIVETDSAELVHLKVLRANASFIRAMSMFEMAMYWGEVPVVEIEDLDKPEVDMSRRPLQEVWGQIISDFTYASENLEDGKQKSARATRPAAYAMLMKSYMYAQPESGVRDFAKALKVFEDHLKGKYGYNLVFDYATLFDEMWPDSREFNLSESVFEVDYICNSSGPNYWQWDMGSRTLAGRTEGEGCFIGGYDVALPTEFCYKMKADGGLWEAGDTRRLVNIRYDFTYPLKADNTPTDNATDYLELGETPAEHPNAVVPSWGADELDPHVKKWEDRRIDKHEPAYNEIKKTAYDEEVTSGSSIYYSGKNYLFIRYADLRLLYAECLNELDRTGEAITAVNTLRQRRFKNAPGYAWSGLTKEQFRDEIMDERMRELTFEGWRRMDLIRTGKFRELVLARNKWAAQKGTIQDFHMRWPIPEKELLTNPFMDPAKDQNPGY